MEEGRRHGEVGEGVTEYMMYLLLINIGYVACARRVTGWVADCISNAKQHDVEKCISRSSL